MSTETERAPMSGPEKEVLGRDQSAEDSGLGTNGGTVTSSTVDRINRRHRRGLDFGKRALEEAINIGCELYDANASIPHWQWLPWVEANLEFTDRTASRYMRLWDRRGYLKQTGGVQFCEGYFSVT